MIRIKLRAAMLAYEKRTGQRLNYALLAELTGLKHSMLTSMGRKQGYNASLKSIEQLCVIFECEPGDLLELVPRREKRPAKA